MSGKDKRLHGSFGDSVIPQKDEGEEVEEREEQIEGDGKQQKTAKSFKPNALLYLKKIKQPDFAAELKRKGCSGWPCHAGFLCDFCMLRPEWIAEAKLEPLTVSGGHASGGSECRAGGDRRAQAVDRHLATAAAGCREVRTGQRARLILERAERLVAGKYWSKSDEERKLTLNSMLEDSTASTRSNPSQDSCRASARQLAGPAVEGARQGQGAGKQREAELKRDSSLFAAAGTREHQPQAAGHGAAGDAGRHKEEAELRTSLLLARARLTVLVQVEKDLEDKRSMISEAFKEKSRSTAEARRLKLEVEATNMEIAAKNEQVDEEEEEEEEEEEDEERDEDEDQDEDQDEKREEEKRDEEEECLSASHSRLRSDPQADRRAAEAAGRDRRARRVQGPGRPSGRTFTEHHGRGQEERRQRGRGAEEKGRGKGEERRAGRRERRGRVPYVLSRWRKTWLRLSGSGTSMSTRCEDSYASDPDESCADKKTTEGAGDDEKSEQVLCTRLVCDGSNRTLQCSTRQNSARIRREEGRNDCVLFLFMYSCATC
eukprot:3067-Hanusia_phi.AAC.1